MQQQAGWLETLEKPWGGKQVYPGSGALRSFSEVELGDSEKAVGSEDPRAAAARLRPDSSDAGGAPPVISPLLSSPSSAAPVVPLPPVRCELSWVSLREGGPLLSSAERRER